MRKTLIALIALAVICMPAMALHKDGSELVCSGCHVMHDGANLKLLKAGTTEELCLQCHSQAGSQHGVYPAPIVMDISGALDDGIAGDFADMDDVQDNGDTTSTGNGHNYGNTGVPLTIPGSTSAAMNIDCGSCHDAHGSGYADDSSDDIPAVGTVDYYRNLWQWPPEGNGSGADIVMSLKDITLTNEAYSLAETSYGVANASRSGFTQWCGSCHDEYLAYGKVGADWTRHPNDEDMTEDDGDSDLGDFANYTGASTPVMPLQDSTTASVANAGPKGNNLLDEVFCLTCHQAHGSTFKDGLRWDNTSTNPLEALEGCQACHSR